MRSTEELAAAAEARLAAAERLTGLLTRTTGWASDPDGSVTAEVDGRGGLQRLRLTDAAIALGPRRLGEVIVEVAQAAARDATQRAYNQMALALGDTVTAAIEGLGTPAPARDAERDDPASAGAQRSRVRPDAARPDLAGFDPSILRSDR